MYKLTVKRWLLPVGSSRGGEIVAVGAPEDVARMKRSYTGEYLKPVLARGAKAKRKGQVAAE